MSFSFEFDRNTPTNDDRLEWVLFKFYPTCQINEEDCHEVEDSASCPLSAHNQTLREAFADFKFKDLVCEVVDVRLPILGLNWGACSIRGVSPGVDSCLEMRQLTHGSVCAVAFLLRWRWPRELLEGRIFATVVTRWFPSEYPVGNVPSSRRDEPTVERDESDLVGTLMSWEDPKEAEYSEEGSDSTRWSNTLYMRGSERISGAAAVTLVQDL